MTFFKKYFLPILIVVLTPISVNQWTSMPVGNTFTSWILYLLLMLGFIFQKKYFFDKTNDTNLKFVKVYLLWVLICFIRGIIVAENYWDFKNLIDSGFALFLTYSIFVFTNPSVVQNMFRTWLQYALPLFLVFIFFMDRGASGYYLAPLSFIGLFFPLLNTKWKIVVLFLFLFVIVVGLDVRSNVIKYIVTFLLSFLFYFKSILKSKIFKFSHLILLIFPFVLLFLGISNIFNIFKMDEYIKGDYETTSVIAGQKEADDLKADSRSFLYEEVLLSAVKNDYVIMGRTLARGNDSNSFGAFFAEDLGTHRYERASNEVSILNIFTWTGLIGVVLYFLIFFKAAQLAIYCSNSSYMKILGFYVSFRWAFGWIEDYNRFDIMNLTLWIVIAMCYSKQFRKMSDRDVKMWLNGIFTNNYKKPQMTKYQVPSYTIHKVK
ncbi:MAG: hypothetical protein GZ087_11415 [Flavobacterium sp.]|nr:hypothetical protein [Flavobacterium sp.]